MLDVAPATIHTDPRLGHVRHSLADLQRAEAPLGYRPEVAWGQGLRRTAEYLRALARDRGDPC